MDPDEVDANAVSRQTQTRLTIVMLLGLVTVFGSLLFGRFEIAAVGLVVMLLAAWTLGQLAHRQSESDAD